MSGGSLKDQRIVIYGAGSAGMGIADQIKDGLMILDGLDKNEAARRFWCVDRNGLLVESMGNALRHAQMAYARPDEEVREWRRENEGHDAIRLLDGEFVLLDATEEDGNKGRRELRSNSGLGHKAELTCSHP